MKIKKTGRKVQTVNRHLFFLSSAKKEKKTDWSEEKEIVLIFESSTCYMVIKIELFMSSFILFYLLSLLGWRIKSLVTVGMMEKSACLKRMRATSIEWNSKLNKNWFRNSDENWVVISLLVASFSALNIFP